MNNFNIQARHIMFVLGAIFGANLTAFITMLLPRNEPIVWAATMFASGAAIIVLIGILESKGDNK